MKREIPSPVIIAVISAMVVIVLYVGWFYLRPASPERVSPRQDHMTRMSLLRQGLAPGRQAGSRSP